MRSYDHSHLNETEKPVELGRFVRRGELEIDKLFRALVKFEGSDLHLKVGSPPIIRVAGTLRPLNRGPIDEEEMARLVLPLFHHDAQRMKISRRTAAATSPIRCRSTTSAGGSASTCCSRWAAWAWWPGG